MIKKSEYRDLSNVSPYENPIGKGKRDHQKLKPYLVLQLLMKHSDENHPLSADKIIDLLSDYGIAAERRSIYRDIADINKAMWAMENECSMEEAEEAIEDKENRIIVYRASKENPGFYVRQRQYDLDDIRLLAESVYTARFLSKGQSDRLAKVLCGLVSEYQADTIQHDAHVVDRIQTNNRSVLQNIHKIKQAMSPNVEGKRHIPEKIRFHYLSYMLNDLEHPAARRKGAFFVVSPYKLLINESNYYLLAFDEKSQKMKTYRVDRMRDVDTTGEPREGAEAFSAIDMKRYTQRVFSMYGGRQERVTIRFINPLLDAALDRFGSDTQYVRYAKYDDRHFTVTTDIEISDQFFGWLLGFGTKAKLIGPDPLVDQFRRYLTRIMERY